MVETGGQAERTARVPVTKLMNALLSISENIREGVRLGHGTFRCAINSSADGDVINCRSSELGRNMICDRNNIV